MKEPTPKSTGHIYLDFEKPISELEGKAYELRRMAAESVDSNKEVLINEAVKLEAKAQQLLQDTYAKLTPWQKTQVARHPNRPHFLDYMGELVEDFTNLAGDRAFGEDEAVMAGIGRFRGQTVAFIGHEKGSDTQSRIRHNFGMGRPEGYRKGVRIMELAERFNIPVITLIDTAGAYPGLAGEERGQAEAIARSTDLCLRLGVPLIAVITGEGMSGGAIAFATANHVAMLEHATYAVISPEGCASILFKNSDKGKDAAAIAKEAAEKARDAAAAMKITAQDLASLSVIDEIIEEPMGGAHRDAANTIAKIGGSIEAALNSLSGMAPDELRRQRRDKFLRMGREGLA